MWVSAILGAMSSQKRGARLGRDYWERVIEAFGRSGQNQREYCESRGVRYTAFRNWLYRLRHEVGTQPRCRRGKAQFVQVVPTAPVPGVLCKVRLGTAEVFFSELPPAAYLGDLLRTMDR
jgi:hypothetical protein